jgi:hypothetical protein
MLRRRAWRWLRTLGVGLEGALLSCCTVSLVLSGVSLGATEAGGADTAPAAAATAIESLRAAFAEDATSIGLALAGEPTTKVLRVAPNGDSLVAVTLLASVPPAERQSPIFYWRRTVYAVAGVAGAVRETARNDTTIAFDGALVTVQIADSFAAGSGGDLDGKEIRRVAEFEADSIDDLFNVSTAAAPGVSESPFPAAPTLFPAGAAQERNYHEMVTVVNADGSSVTYPAERFRLGDLLGEGGAAGIGCVTQCFSDHGGEIGFAGAACLVAGAVVCAVACGATAGVACLPCIGGAGTACGLAVGTGALAGCIASCLFGYTPPTATPRPQPSPTPRPTPDTRTYTLSTVRSTVPSGKPIRLSWTAPAGHSTTDWVGLFYAGGDNRDYIRFEYMTAESSGTLSISAPDLPGLYECRILLNNGYAEPATPARVSLNVREEGYAGDCDEDGQITVSELVLGVGISLSRVSMAVCPAFDLDGNDVVGVDELIVAVHNALTL